MAAAVAPPASAVLEPQSNPHSEQQLANLVKKLTALRNDVVAGSHPRLKLPPRIGDQGRLQSAVGGMTASSLPGLSNGIPDPPPPVGSTLPPVPATTTNSTPPNGFKPNFHHVATVPASTSGIDPIFLEKSDTLVKAEAQAKRDRLENNLEEQAQLKKNSMRHKTHEEFAMPDFSVDDVLKGAHTLVHPVLLRREGPANGGASSTDSFDENTFYSSQMNESTSTEGEVIEEPKRHVRPKLCRFFLNDKHCPYGDHCQFSHDRALKARVDGPGSVSHGRDVDGTNIREEINLRNKSPPRPAPKKGIDGKNDQTTVAEPSLQQQRIAQLEAELQAMKAKEAQQSQNQRQPAPSTQLLKPQSAAVGPDEFGRDASLRDEIAQQQHHETQQQDLRADREYVGRDRNLISPSTNNVRVVRNHITSPHAPQPARVSPLAVTKVSQVHQNQAEGPRTSRIPYAEVISDGSPRISAQPLSSRKRRRGRDSGEQNRNVVPRNGTSPQIRIKDEPISPPPLQELPPRRVSGQDAARPLYIDTALRAQDRIVRQTRNSDRTSNIYEATPLGPPVRRVLSRNGQHYLANDEPDLRRVVSERQLRAPVSPTPRYAPSPYTEPRIVRASSQAYISPSSHRPHVDYRASVQPQPVAYGRSPSPLLRDMSPIGPSSTIMAPPRRRVLMDQYGNEFLESELRQVSVAPVSRPSMHPQYDESGNRIMEPRYTSVVPQVEPRYEQQRPRVEVIRNAFEDDERPSHFVDRPPSPASPKYLDYSRPVQAVHQHDRAPGEGSYVRDYPSTRVIYQESRQEPIYETSNGQSGGTYQVQNLRPVEDRYERISRIPSVQPRIVQLTERQPVSPLASQQASVRPSENFARPESFGGHYQYAPSGEQEGGYYREVPQNAAYGSPRRIVQRM